MGSSLRIGPVGSTIAGVWLVVGVVVVAGVLMALARRSPSPDDLQAVSAVSDQGLQAGDRLVSWASVYRVEILTRKGLTRTWYGFEIRSEEAAGLAVDGDGALGEQFLAHTYHLGGFDHATVTRALTERLPRAVCFNR